MQEVDWQGILGGPIRVQVSISLRNILEIDELRQVAKNDEIANFFIQLFLPNACNKLGMQHYTYSAGLWIFVFHQKYDGFLNSEFWLLNFYCYTINSQT